MTYILDDFDLDIQKISGEASTDSRNTPFTITLAGISCGVSCGMTSCGGWCATTPTCGNSCGTYCPI